jgi:hypothetical protein
VARAGVLGFRHSSRVRRHHESGAARLAARALRGSHWGGDYGDVATYSGVAGITWALTRYLGTGLTYAYYRHDLAGGVALAPGFPNHFDGQTIRASVSVWAPVFQRARRPE